MDQETIRDQIRLSAPPEVTDVTDGMLNTLINQSLQEISIAEKWPFLQTSSTVSVTDGTQNYDLPADFLYAETLVDDDHDTRIAYLTPGQFFQWYGNSTTSGETTTADVFTVWQNDIYLHPIPSTDDTDRYTLYYYKTITALSGNSDEPEFLSPFHWLCVDWVKWHLYERGGLTEEADRQFQNYMNRLTEMRNWYRTVVKPEPYIAGDGFSRRWGQWDPNLPILNYIQ